MWSLRRKRKLARDLRPPCVGGEHWADYGSWLSGSVAKTQVRNGRAAIVCLWGLGHFTGVSLSHLMSSSSSLFNAFYQHKESYIIIGFLMPFSCMYSHPYCLALCPTLYFHWSLSSNLKILVVFLYTWCRCWERNQGTKPTHNSSKPNQIKQSIHKCTDTYPFAHTYT